MTDYFDVEVPEPLAKFEGVKIIDPQNETILSSEVHARIMNRKQLRKAEKLLGQIEAVLSNLPPLWKRLWWKWTKYPYELRDVDMLLEVRKALAVELHEAKIQWVNLKAEFDNNPLPEHKAAARIIKANYKEARRELAKVDEIIRPLKKLIIRRNIILARIQEHRQGLEDGRKNAQLTREMAREANYFAEQMSNTFTQMGYCFRYTMGDTTRTDEVKWERIVATPDTLQFKVFVTRMGLIRGTVNKLPQGVKVSDLVKEETLMQLSSACERPVRCVSLELKNFKNGVWFEIDRLGIVDGIPKSITYKTLMGVYPAHQRDKIPLMLGVQKGRRVNIVYMRDNPHYLIAGQTGSGKTVAYHGIICTLIRNYSPREIRIIFIDLKEGVAFRRYTHLPHTLGEMIEDPAGVVPVLAKLEAERKRRMVKIREIAETVDEYNTMVAPENRIPRIVVMFDEYGAINGTDKTTADQIYSLTSQLAKKARAAGIHLVIGAQTPYVSDVPQSVKANLTFSLVGKQKTLGASLSSTGDRQAYDLPDVPGRMIAEGRGSNYQVQLPLVEPDDIMRAIETAMHYEPGPDLLADIDENLEEVIQESKPKPFTEKDFIAWTLLNNQGVISPRKLFDLMEEPVITQRQILAMGAKLSAQKTITFEGRDYQVVRWGKGFRLQEIEISDASISPIQVFDEQSQVYEEYQEPIAS